MKLTLIPPGARCVLRADEQGRLQASGSEELKKLLVTENGQARLSRQQREGIRRRYGAKYLAQILFARHQD